MAFPWNSYLLGLVWWWTLFIAFLLRWAIGKVAWDEFVAELANFTAIFILTDIAVLRASWAFLNSIELCDHRRRIVEKTLVTLVAYLSSMTTSWTVLECAFYALLLYIFTSANSHQEISVVTRYALHRWFVFPLILITSWTLALWWYASCAILTTLVWCNLLNIDEEYQPSQNHILKNSHFFFPFS